MCQQSVATCQHTQIYKLLVSTFSSIATNLLLTEAITDAPIAHKQEEMLGILKVQGMVLPWPSNALWLDANSICITI